MTITRQLILLFAASYLLGSIPFGLIVAGLKRTDIRKHGSGNVGATNVGRVLGRRWGVLVLILDAGKGALAAALAGLVIGWSDVAWIRSEPAHTDWVLLGAGVCALVGNIAPFYLAFRGGKGVAVSLGFVLGVYPYLTVPALAAGMVWLVAVGVSRYVSLGSILAACALPIAFVVAAAFSTWSLAEHYPLFCLTLAMSGVVLVRHRGNMGRLLSGTENKFGREHS